MEKTYFIDTKIGKSVIVDKKEFNDFIELFEILHPDYCVKIRDFKGHIFTEYFVENERYCLIID